MQKPTLEIQNLPHVSPQRFAPAQRRGEKTAFAFLMAHSFSGSTLLSLLLGGHPEIATVGEMFIASGVDIQSYLCSCGERIADCGFWNRVSREMAQRGLPFDVRTGGASLNFGRARLAQRLVAAEPRGRLAETARRAALRLIPGSRRELERRLLLNEALVETIMGIQGGRVFLDASKVHNRALLLQRIPSFEIRVIHLVRDARAVARSVVRNVGRTIEEGARSWAAAIRLAEQAQRRFPPERWTTVRYEDLCGDTDATLERIFRFLDVSPGYRMRDFRSTGHHIIGNRMRLSQVSEIRPDESWRRDLPPPQVKMVERIAGPELRRYGYQGA